MYKKIKLSKILPVAVLATATIFSAQTAKASDESGLAIFETANLLSLKWAEKAPKETYEKCKGFFGTRHKIVDDVIRLKNNFGSRQYWYNKAKEAYKNDPNINTYLEFFNEQTKLNAAKIELNGFNKSLHQFTEAMRKICPPNFHCDDVDL